MTLNEAQKKFKGKKCRVFEDPITREHLEGEGVIENIGIVRKEDNMIFASVLFEDEHSEEHFDRWISLENIEE